MKKIIIIVVALFIDLKMYAQEVDLPQYVNHMADNPFLISPSYAGIGAGFQLRLNGVSQWIGVKGAPNTQSIAVEGRFTDVFAGGLTIFNDSNGATKQMGAKGSLAYHLTMSRFHDSFLSFAMSASYTQFRISTEDFENQIKQSLANYSDGTLNFDVSMLFRYERFAISVNAANLLSRRIKALSYKEPEILRKYSVYSLYTFKVNRDLEIEPSVFVELFEASRRSRSDVNVKLRKRIKDGYYWIGLSYSFLNDQFGEPIGIAPLIGLKKNKFYLSYGVGITTNELANYNYGTHMITLGFDYDIRPSLARCTQDMVMF